MGYVIVVAFISSPLELIRVPELALYLYRRFTAKTRLEKEKALSKVCLPQSLIVPMLWWFNVFVYGMHAMCT